MTDLVIALSSIQDSTYTKIYLQDSSVDSIVGVQEDQPISVATAISTGVFRVYQDSGLGEDIVLPLYKDFRQAIKAGLQKGQLYVDYTGVVHILTESWSSLHFDLSDALSFLRRLF